MAERIIYESSKEELENLLFQVQQLEDEGINMSSLPDEIFEHIKEIIEEEDQDKLSDLRDELKDITR